MNLLYAVIRNTEHVTKHKRGTGAGYPFIMRTVRISIPHSPGGGHTTFDLLHETGVPGGMGASSNSLPSAVSLSQTTVRLSDRSLPALPQDALSLCRSVPGMSYT